MFCKILYLLVALCPLPPCPMPNKCSFHENFGCSQMNDSKQLKGSYEICGKQIDDGNLHEGNKVEILRRFPLDERDKDQFHYYIQKKCDGVQQFLEKYLPQRVQRHNRQKVRQRLKSLDLVVKESVWVDMVADAVHLLPLTMSKSCYQIQISKGMVFHMNEIMSHAQEGVDGYSTEDSQDKELIDGGEYEEYEPQGYKHGSIDHRLPPILQLLYFMR